MRKLIAAVAAALTLAAGAVPALGQTTSGPAKEVIAAARAASGGAGWNQLRGLSETGKLDGVAYRAWYDPVRYGARVETDEAAGRRVHGFNGAGDWVIHPDRTIRGRADRAAMAQARTAAYLAVNGWYFPSRFAANISHAGVRQGLGGRSFDVLKVEPMGGEPRELWFDRKTHLLARIVDRTGGRQVATELSDYRRVEGLMLPFRAVTDRGGRPSVRQAEAITLTPADRAKFSWTAEDGTYTP